MESNMFEKILQIIPVLLLEEKTGIHYGSIKFSFSFSQAKFKNLKPATF